MATIATSTANDGTHVWTLPGSLASASDYRIKITDYLTLSYFDYSDDYFIIADVPSCELLLLSPNGGEAWQKGSGHSIEWTKNGSGCGASVRIDLFKGGAFFAVVAWSAPNNGSFWWVIPVSLADGSDYQVKITDTDSGTVSDISDAMFALVSPGVPPVANFEWSPVNPHVGEVVQFTDGSSGAPTSWWWTFGDGHGASTPNPSHAFAEARSYAVRLVVGNAHGTSERTRTVTVSPAAVGPTHQADTNDDWRLEIGEATLYSSAWKTGQVWPREPNPIPIGYMTNAWFLWKSGETYHYNGSLNPPWAPGASATSGGISAAALGSGTATSTFSPTSYAPGQGVQVSVAVTPGSGTQVYAVEDAPPLGWAVSGIDNGGQWDGVNKKVKWGPFFDNQVRTLTYMASPPAGETGTKTFSGIASFDGTNVAIGGARSISSGAPPSGNTAVSSFNPSSYTPGQGVQVSIGVTPGTGTQVYALEDAPPVGWTVSGIDIGGQWDNINKKVKWGPFFDNQVRTLTYLATPPAGETGTKPFSGIASFDGTNVTITGQRSIGPVGSYSYWVQVAARAAGLAGSQWYTDLGLFNPGSAQASVEVRLYPAGGSAVKTNTTYVPAGAQSVLTDVGGQLGHTGQGALEIRSDVPLKVTSRTYNKVASAAACTPNGTFGQYYAAYTPADGLENGEAAFLPHLVENTRFRSNLAFTNMGSTPATLSVELFNGAGVKLTTFTVSLNPAEYKQEAQVFKNRAGQTSLDRGSAKVTVTSGSGVIVSASVVDNLTNDPTTIPMQR